MRDEAKRYEGSTFAIEKAVATVYVAMFVAIVTTGVHKQLNRINPSEPQQASLTSNELIQQ